MKMKRSGWMRKALLCLAMAAVPVCSMAQKDTGIIPGEDFTPERFSPVSNETEMVKINGETIDAERLKLLAALRPIPGVRIDPDFDVPALRGEQLAQVARWIGAFDSIAKEAKKDGVKMPADIQERVDNIIGQLTNQMLYKEIVLDKTQDPSEEQIKARYEETKDAQYSQKEELRMRHIYVGTYDTYTTEAGDSLESIAKKIAGDEAYADRIVSDQTKRPRVEGLEGENEEGEEVTLPARALTTGEVLLVPNPKKEAEASEKIYKALGELEEGKSFVEVAKEYSESANPGALIRINPETDNRNIMPELEQTFVKLKDGGYSEPLRTKHGYQIVFREKYIPEGYRPLAEVKEQIKNTLRNEQGQKIVESFFSGLVNNPDYVTIYEDKALAADGDSGDVLVKIGDKNLTREDINKNTRQALVTSDIKTVDDFKEFLWKRAYLQNVLLDAYKKDKGFFERAEPKRYKEMVTNSYLVSTYAEEQVDKKFEEPSEQALIDYYEENKETYKVREAYTLFMAYVPTDKGASDQEAARQAAMDEMNKKAKGIQALQEFRDMADSTNPTTDRALGPGGVIGYREARALDDALVDQLRKVTVPGKTEVFYDSNADRAVVYWVSDKKEESIPSFAEKKEQIAVTVGQQMRGKLLREYVAGYAKDAKVEVLLDEPEANDEEM